MFLKLNLFFYYNIFVKKQSEIQKRKQTRRYSDEYINVLNNSSEFEIELNESICDLTMSDMSAVNIEQEWNDFDEIMTENTLGIRLQAQLLMEKKVMLREQQKQIRNKIAENKNNKTINIPDIPDENTISTIDELYGSFHSNNNNNSTSSDDVYSNEKRSRESEILYELKSLSNDIDYELQLVENKIIDKNYNNKMIEMIKNKNNNNSLINILPFHRSQTQNKQLLKIIHTIENMPKPFINNNNLNENNNENINVIIPQFSQTLMKY